MLEDKPTPNTLEIVGALLYLIEKNGITDYDRALDILRWMKPKMSFTNAVMALNLVKELLISEDEMKAALEELKPELDAFRNASNSTFRTVMDKVEK